MIDLSRQFPALVLSGARQAGKTTLLKQTFPSFHYVSLDLPTTAEIAEKDPRLFLQKNSPPVIVDEVQYAPLLFRNLKVVIDSMRHQMGQFILTGSQKFVLMKEISDSLAGRVAILNLENLSAAELALTSNSPWFQILSRGFFPELWRLPELSRNDFFQSYVSTYLERDVRQILNVQSLRDFERFLRACAARSAQLLNLSDLARDVGIKPQTAKDWLGVLEASNQISLLEPYYENVGKRLVKSPKLYLNDPGMLCFLLGIDESTLANSPLVGPVWETFVYSELRKKIAASDSSATIWYYRDAQGWEVDFLLVDQGKIDLYEAKWTESADKRWASQIQDAMTVLSRSKTQRMGNSYVVCRIQEPAVVEGVRFIHPPI